jgi:exodeoxyribonuclease V alpha subunit
MTASSQEIVGVLTSCEVYNERWGRGIVRLEDGDYLVVTGESLVGLTQGNRYRMDGTVVHHPKFGRQFECKVASIDIPLEAEALVRHLRKNFKGCGEVTARKIVEQYRGNLPALRDQLVSNPYALDFGKVTRRKIAVAGAEDMKGLIYRDMSTRIGMTGVSDSVLRKVADWLAIRVEGRPEPIVEAWALFSKDPYAPIRDIDGYGFVAADLIALRGIGFSRFHACRLAALATHALRDGCERGGHTFLSGDDIAARIAQIDPDVSPERALLAAMERKEPIIIDAQRCYPRHLWMAERALARQLAVRALTIATPICQEDESVLGQRVAEAEALLSTDDRSFRLDESQRKAVMGLLTSQHLVHTLTAGPGCGKTALMEVLVNVAPERTFLFCAPTGKAAKVLSTRVKRFGLAATTIHAMLGVGPEGFHFNEHNPLDAHIVVVDESSMIDLMLARALLDAVPPGAHLIFLGDADQLPSVGPGNVLRDLLQLPFNHHRLVQPYRNDGGILDVVQQAGKGMVDGISRDSVHFSDQLPEPEPHGIAVVTEAYFEAIACYGIQRVALLMPRRKGDPRLAGWNTTYLNEVLRHHLNADGERIAGTTLRVGDRIIIRKNIAIERGEDAEGNKLTEQVVNGDTGFIRDYLLDTSGRTVVHVGLALDDGRDIRFPGKDIDAIGLAYAMTVHAAQGSEYDEVLFICTNGSPQFVHRGVIYTALSRARKKLSIWADRWIMRAVAARDIPARNSELASRTRSTMRHVQKAGGLGANEHDDELVTD